MAFLQQLRTQSPLTNDQIMRVAPSVFAADKHESRTKRYTYLPTIDALNALRREGFEVFAVQQSRTRDESKREHTKHMLRLRHMGATNALANVGDTYNEITLINSHDGSSAWEMCAAAFRLACLNGLVVPDSVIDRVKVRHSGNVIGEVQEGAFRILQGFDRAVASREAMMALPLNTDEREAFASAAIALRYPEAEAMPLRPQAVLQARRPSDRGADLWATFNVVQENLVQGGLRLAQPEGQPRARRQRSRAVNSIDGNVNLNRALWMLAERMRELRGESVAA
jgi:hypothetical protein